MQLRFIVTLGLAAIISSSALAQTAPDLSGKDTHWIKDNSSNCWAANPDPSPGESITWTGACENNLLSGQGTLTWYINGKAVGRDEGNFRNGELSGHGRLSFADGANYEGEFPGKGVLTLPNGQKIEAETIHEQAGWSIEQTHP